MAIYSCDFETTTDKDDCRVWAWAALQLYKHEDYTTGNTIEEFMEWLQKLSRREGQQKCYFHNLKFDLEFILSYLLNNGFQFVEEAKYLEAGYFTTLISDMNQVYTAEICFAGKGKKRKSVKLIDSLKVIPMPVKKIPKAFGLSIEKLEIDYGEKREVGHELTEQERRYLRHDVEVVALALEKLFDQGMTKLTTGSNAMAEYKGIISKDKFAKWFPTPEFDSDIRQAYKGGYSYVNPIFQGQELGSGIVLDVNSLYPSVMYYNRLPYGEGIYFDGKYKQDSIYNLHIQMFSCAFRLRKGKLATVQLKNCRQFCSTEYLNDSADQYVTMCMTDLDMRTFFSHYDVFDITWIGGWKWKSTDILFRDYIDKWMQVKIDSTKNGNEGMRTLAKLMLNSLYGKFALNPDCQKREPYLKEDGSIGYRLLRPEKREPIYIPVGVFVTAGARYKTITSAQKLYDRFVYADTDSLHLVGTEVPTELDVDPVKLGAWKHESTFEKAKFLHSKCYIEVIDGKEKITAAGMPADCYQHVTFDNFSYGACYDGKLRPVHVAGGVVLEDSQFTIRL